MIHPPGRPRSIFAKHKRAGARKIWIVTEPPDSRNMAQLSELREIVFGTDGDGLQRQFVGGLVGSNIVGFHELQADADEHGRFLLEQQCRIKEIRDET